MSWHAKHVIAWCVAFVIIGLLLFMLPGCASSEVRLTEYAGKAKPGLVGVPYVSGDLTVRGCRVVQSGEPLKGCAMIEGVNGYKFQSESCRQ